MPLQRWPHALNLSCLPWHSKISQAASGVSWGRKACPFWRAAAAGGLPGHDRSSARVPAQGPKQDSCQGTRAMLGEAELAQHVVNSRPEQIEALAFRPSPYSHWPCRIPAPCPQHSAPSGAPHQQRPVAHRPLLGPRPPTAGLNIRFREAWQPAAAPVCRQHRVEPCWLPAPQPAWWRLATRASGSSTRRKTTSPPVRSASAPSFGSWLARSGRSGRPTALSGRPRRAWWSPSPRLPARSPTLSRHHWILITAQVGGQLGPGRRCPADVDNPAAPSASTAC